MVGGLQIDWACHANDKGTTIREMLDFDRAIIVQLTVLKPKTIDMTDELSEKV